MSSYLRHRTRIGQNTTRWSQLFKVINKLGVREMIVRRMPQHFGVEKSCLVGRAGLELVYPYLQKLTTSARLCSNRLELVRYGEDRPSPVSTMTVTGPDFMFGSVFLWKTEKAFLIWFSRELNGG